VKSKKTYGGPAGKFSRDNVRVQLANLVRIDKIEHMWTVGDEERFGAFPVKSSQNKVILMAPVVRFELCVNISPES